MRNNQLVIIGAGGHAGVVSDIARLSGYEDIIFLDDADLPEASGKVSDYIKYKDCADFIIAIGNSRIRERIHNELFESGCNIQTLIHPNAVIGSNVTFGIGTVVMAGVVINTGTRIGNGVIVNTSSSVDHDCVIDDFSHVSAGAHLCGTVCVSKHTWIGAGATVVNNINICGECMIGAGAVVIKDINSRGTYVGVPARLLKS